MVHMSSSNTSAQHGRSKILYRSYFIQRFMRGYFTGIFGLVVVLLASFASASYITMQTIAETNSTGGTINVTNNGDESAYQVQIISEILDNTYKSEIKSELKVGETFSTKLPIDLSNKKAGTYPLLVTIQYQDANGYLFSALLSRLIENNVPGRSEIVVDLQDAEIKGSVKVPVKVTNFGEQSRDVQLFLFMSGEFSVKDNNRSVSVGPKSHEDVIFTVDNFAARSGSTYAFSAIAEYDSQDGHYGAVDSGGMRVLEKKSQLFDKKMIIIALVVIVIIFVVLQFKRKK